MSWRCDDCGEKDQNCICDLPKVPKHEYDAVKAKLDKLTKICEIQSKPREYWVFDETVPGALRILSFSDDNVWLGSYQPCNPFKVIEKSAYDELKAKLDKAMEFLEGYYESLFYECTIEHWPEVAEFISKWREGK